MATRLRVLIDLNIILDVLKRREPFYEKSAQILAAAELGSIEGYIAAHNVTTLNYILTKYLRTEEAKFNLQQLLSFLMIAPVDQSVIEAALVLSYSDFEDAVLMMAAVNAGIDYVVSRNTQDFQGGPLTALTPAELLSLIQKTIEEEEPF